MPRISLRGPEGRPDIDPGLWNAARDAVAHYEELRSEYETLMADFTERFPEAAAELQNIQLVEDQVFEAIAEAKKRVAEAKVTIGEFHVQRKHSTPAYDPQAVIDICIEEEDRDMLFELFTAGIVKKVNFDRDAAKLFIGQTDELSDRFQRAWRDREELSPSVFTPKFG